MSGTQGAGVNLVTNFFRMSLNMDWTLYQYRVDFTPQIDAKRVRKDIVKAHLNALGLTDSTTFDGFMLFTIMRFQLDTGMRRRTRHVDEEKGIGM